MRRISRYSTDNPSFTIDYNVTSSSCSIRKISDQSVRQRSMMLKKNDGNPPADVNYKILLLGDSQVGKTSLQRAIAGKDFRTDIGATIGVDFVNKIIPVEGANVNLQIWDTAGQRNFRTITKSYYAATKAFLLVFDVTNVETFQLVEHFSQSIEDAKLDTQRRYLVANKIDLVEQRRVDEETGRRFALRNSLIYFETSCKTGENILDLFEQIASDLVRQHHPKLLNSHRPIRIDFPFDYQRSISREKEQNSSIDPKTNNKKKKKGFFASFFYDSMEKNEPFTLRRFIFCCRPKKS